MKLQTDKDVIYQSTYVTAVTYSCESPTQYMIMFLTITSYV